jgi:hypothetical protein
MTGHCAQSVAWHRDDFGPRVNPHTSVKRQDAASKGAGDMCAKDMKSSKDAKGPKDMKSSKDVKKGKTGM